MSIFLCKINPELPQVLENPISVLVRVLNFVVVYIFCEINPELPQVLENPISILVRVLNFVGVYFFPSSKYYPTHARKLLQ